MREIKKKALSIFVAFMMLFSMVAPPATASAETIGKVTIETTLIDGMTLKGSKKTFDVIARDENDKKIASSVTLNGDAVKVNWDDEVKTSYTLNLTKEGENVVVVSAGGASKTYKIIYEKAQKGDLIGYSTWTIEALTLGSGFIELPMQVPIYEGENAAQMLDRILTEHGYSYSCTGTIASGFYLAILGEGGAAKTYGNTSLSNGCQDPEKGKKLNIPFDPTNQVPEKLASILEENDALPLYEPSYPNGDNGIYGLGEFDFTYMSGWMYAINSVFPNVGFSDSYLSDGDVVRVQFTLYGYGADIGGGYAMGGENTDYYSVANKDKLMTAIAKINSAEDKEQILAKDGVKQAYEKAITVAEQLDATQEVVDKAYSDLQNLLSKPEVKLPFTKVTLVDGTTEIKNIEKSEISVDPWNDGKSTTIPLFTAEVPAGTEYVDIYYPAGSDISEYCAWYDQTLNEYPTQEEGEYTLEKLKDGSFKLRVKIDKTGDGNTDTFIMEDSSFKFVNAFTFKFENGSGAVGATGVSLNKNDAEIKNGEQLQLEAKVAPNNAANKKVTWESSDSSIASVDENGLVTANAEGKATIKVTTLDGGHTAECEVSVLPSDSELEVEVKIATNPEDAIIFLTDIDGNRILPLENGNYLLRKGSKYNYIITKYGYVCQVGSFVAGEQTPNVTLEKAANNETIKTDIPSQWPNFRGNQNNNAVVNVKTPKNANEANLYWSTKVGEGFGGNAIGSPIIVDDYLIFCSGKSIYKMNKFTGEIVAQREEMVGKSNFNIIPPTYAEGLIFIGLANGTVQAFNADTLESVWVYKDALRGQPNSPIIYNDGYIYTGFWNSETKNANYVCLSVTDEDINNKLEEKTATWKHTQRGGFYWSGAYVCDDFLLVGTDDGNGGYLSDTSNLLSLNPKTGEVIDKIENLNGDIRSSVSYDKVTNRYYFASKGGSFYSIAVNKDGTFKKDVSGVQGYDLKEILLDNGADDPETPPMSTSTPVVHNGRAYIGVSGTSQFGQYTGHNITVLDLTKWEIAYKVPTKGYPQTSGLLSTAYEDSEGYAYVYFIDNYTPGQVRVIKDKPGVTSTVDGVTEKYINNKGQLVTLEGCGPVLFTPSGPEAEYAICSPIVDEEGTLYFKNDSARMMALGSKIDHISITEKPQKTTYVEGETFDSTGMKVIAYLKNGLQRDITKYVSFSKDPLTTSDTDITVSYNHVKYGDEFDGVNGNKTNVEVVKPEAYINIVVLASGDQNTINHVQNLINEIGEVTLDSGKSIEIARKSYDALDDSLKEHVSNYNILTEAEAEYALISDVAAKIEANKEVSYSKADAIRNARSAYDALTPKQKSKITNYKMLLDEEKELQSIIDEIENVKTLIGNIGTVTLDSEEAIDMARKAYDLLPEESKVGVGNYDVLTKAEESLKTLKEEAANSQKPSDPEKPSEDKNTQDVPKAGDENNLINFIIIGVLSAAGILAMRRFKENSIK